MGVGCVAFSFLGRLSKKNTPIEGDLITFEALELSKNEKPELGVVEEDRVRVSVIEGKPLILFRRVVDMFPVQVEKGFYIEGVYFGVVDSGESLAERVQNQAGLDLRAPVSC